MKNEYHTRSRISVPDKFTTILKEINDISLAADQSHAAPLFAKRTDIQSSEPLAHDVLTNILNSGEDDRQASICSAMAPPPIHRSLAQLKTSGARGHQRSEFSSQAAVNAARNFGDRCRSCICHCCFQVVRALVLQQYY